MRKFIPLVLVVIFLTACQVDPRKTAEAYKTTTEADSQAAQEAEALRYSQQMNDLSVHDAQQKQIAKDAALAERMKSAKRFIAWVSFVFTVAVCVALVYLTYSSSIVMKGAAKAAVQAADLKSRLIPVDKDTGMFPLIVQPVSDNRIAVHNPNDGSILIIDASKEPSAHKVTVSGYLATAGVLARNAAKAQDAKSISMIDPQVINPTSAPMTIDVEGDQDGTEA